MKNRSDRLKKAAGRRIELGQHIVAAPAPVSLNSVIAEFVDLMRSGDYDFMVKSDRNIRGQATKVFLSYSAEDRKVARALASRLAEAGFETWDPAAALFPGDNWALRIGQALQESDAMVVLVSPDSMKSESVRQ